MNKRDVLFLYIGNADDDDRVEIPLGVAFLGGQLKRDGFTYDFIDLYNLNFDKEKLNDYRRGQYATPNAFPGFNEKLFNYLQENMPLIIGISSSSYYLNECGQIIDSINEFYEKSGVRGISGGEKVPITILGGYISLIPDILEKINADFLVHGEGEHTLIEIIKEIYKLKSYFETLNLTEKNNSAVMRTNIVSIFENIPGIEFNYGNLIRKFNSDKSRKSGTSSKDKNNGKNDKNENNGKKGKNGKAFREIHKSKQPYKPISDLSSLAFPDYTIFDINKYRKSQKAATGKIDSLPFYSQRGCYNSCTFCDIVPFYQCQYVRRMNPERIIEWIRQVQQQFGISRIDFMDDNFLNYRPFLERLFSLLEESVKSGELLPVKLNFQARSNEIIRFKSLIGKYKTFINCIELGTESFAQSQLDRWKKHISSLQNIQAIDILSELDIPYINFYLWFDEKTTTQEIDENIEKLLSLPPVRIVGTDITVPNFILNYEISAIYDRLGNSSVRNTFPLNYAEQFLNETNEWAKKLSLAYIGMKKINKSYASSNSHVHLNSVKDTFFPLIERQMKQRLFFTIGIIEKGMPYRRLSCISILGTIYRRNIEKIYNNYLFKFINEAGRIIKPLEENLNLDFSKFSGF